MGLRFVLVALVAGVLGVAGWVRGGRHVLLHGVGLGGVEVVDQKFGNGEVRFDGDGHVPLSAPGVDSRKRDARPARQPAAGRGSAKRDDRRAARLTKRYYLAHQGDRAGKVQYDVAVYINGKRIASFPSGADDGVVEVTRHLKPGANRVRVVATKRLGKSGKRRSFSPKDRLKIVVGEGEAVRGVVTIRRTVVQVERNASETGTFTDRFSFETR